MRRTWGWVALGLGLVLVLGACSDGDSNSTTEVSSVNETVTTTTSDSAAASEDTTTTEAEDGDEPASSAGAGSAILTVGDQKWTFDEYYCFFTTEDTGNDRVSFSSGAFGENEDGRIQLDASIQDTEKQGRYEGEGTIQSVTLDDVENLEDPSVGWSAVSGMVGSPEFLVQVDGDKVTVEASFDDSLTFEIESVPGTLEATCGT